MIRLLFTLCFSPLVSTAAELHVGKGQAHGTITAAIAAAAAGDTIRVHSGVYQEGNIKVNKPVKLIGQDWPVVDGQGTCEVITITTPGVAISGFEVRNSGVGSLQDYAGIRVFETSNATVSNNRLRACNFGIYMSRSADCRVIENEVLGKIGDEEHAGNGIHLWSCQNITVIGNKVRNQRDGIYLEFAKKSVIEHNSVERNLRYGLHYMFSHDSAFRYNVFEHNGAGAAVMYTKNVEMSFNHFANNWGSASYGLMLKEMSDGRIIGNTFDRNSIAVALQGSNRMKITDNRFSENGWAIQVQGTSSDNTYSKNNFAGNSFDIGAEGELDNNRFDHNYWDKYEGYDLKRDGTGDVPFRPVSLYAVVVGRIPSSVLLLRSPVVHLLDQAEKAFPSITPERVVDDAPAMRPHSFPKSPEYHTTTKP